MSQNCPICWETMSDFSSRCSSCKYDLDGIFDDKEKLRIRVWEVKEKFEKGDDFLLLDVREERECRKAKIHGSFLIPLNELSQKMDQLIRDREVVVHCHHGPRSLHAARFLMQNGFKKISFMEGGINAWSMNIDSNVPVY